MYRGCRHAGSAAKCAPVRRGFLVRQTDVAAGERPADRPVAVAVGITAPNAEVEDSGRALLLEPVVFAELLRGGRRIRRPPFDEVRRCLQRRGLVAVGLFVRMRLVETPKFAKVQEQGEISKAPLLDVLTKDFKNFIVAVGLKISEVAWVYVLIGFLVYYATSHLHLSKTVILDAVLYAAILELVTLPLFGLLSDYVGRKPLYIAGTILSMIAAFPLFTLVATKDPTTIAISIAIIMSITHGLMFSPQAAFIPELFGTKVRYSGASLGVQVSAAISGGFAPMIATGLLAYYGTTTPISWYLIALGAITLIATLVSRETAFEDL